MINQLKDDPAKILLVGKVGIDFTAAHVDRALRAVGSRPVEVIIRSGGGDFREGNQIRLRLCELQETQRLAIVASQALSAALWIFLAADRRIVAKNGVLMIHSVADTASGPRSATQLRTAAAALEAVSSVMMETIATRTGQPPEKIFELMENEAHLNASRALELGFATSICGPIY